MNEKKKINKSLITIVIVLLVIFFIAFTIFAHQVRRYAKDAEYNSLQTFTEQAAKTSTLSLEALSLQILGMSKAFNDPDGIDSATAMKILINQSTNSTFSEMGFLSLEGTGISTVHPVVDMSDMPFIKSVQKAEHGVIKIKSNVDDSYSLLSYAPVITKDGKNVGCLYGICDEQHLDSLLNLKSFSENGFTCLLDSNGELLSSNTILDSSLYDPVKNPAAFSELVKQRSSGLFVWKEQKYIGYLQPLSFNNWYLLSIIPQKVIAQKVQHLMFLTVILVAECLSILFILLLCLFHTEKKAGKAALLSMQLANQKLMERYSNEIRNSYDEIFEFDYLNNCIYSLKFSEQGFERIKTPYFTLKDAVKTLSEQILDNPTLMDINQFLSYEHVSTEFGKNGQTELNINVQKRKSPDVYEWYSVCLRKVHWSVHEDGEKSAMFYLKNVESTYAEQMHNQQLLINALHLAETASQAKTEFLSRMSHDIRTPMNAIIGMTTMAKEANGDLDKINSCLNKIEDSSAYLLTLINNILNLSRIEDGKMPINNSDFDLYELLSQIDQLIAPYAQKKQIRYVTTIHSVAHSLLNSDELQLRRILTNLLNNAVKFTPEGGQIDFKVIEEHACASHAQFCFIISDNGIGIPADMKEKILAQSQILWDKGFLT